jgi:hypothetical protein
MNTKALLLSLTNAALYLDTCALVGTGLLLELKMDGDDGAARLFGMGQDDWGEIHFVTAIVFAALAVLHLALHWAWIKAACIRSKPAIVVLFAGLGIVAGLLLWPTTSSGRSLGEQLKNILDD